SRLVSGITGMHVPRNKAVVGENAFAHEAGIHQHGMLQHHSTYEIMRPEDVGLSRSTLVLGKHSGRHAFRDRVRQLGFELDEFETNRAFQEFKKLADRKKDMYDGDIEAIILNVDSSSNGPWILDSLQVSSATGEKSSATITLLDERGHSVQETATADGPAEAVFRALELVTEVDPVLRNFELHSATIGEDAQGEATVVVDYNGQAYRGHGTSTDIVEAAGRAYLEVINRILRRRERGLEEPATSDEINRASI
ncbi:MAG TPA: alpha-isopropylmalate synthase regulatory domain-containing protein, partial [Woeseiaceae bacterium]